MEGCYEVYLGDKPAGKLQIVKEGLYCRLLCRCHVPDDRVYRLFAVTEQGRENLGVVLPEDGGCILKRRVPAKYLREGARYLLSVRDGTAEERYVPVYPEEPFFYISRLEDAFLEIRNGQPGLLWKKGPGAE